MNLILNIRHTASPVETRCFASHRACADPKGYSIKHRKLKHTVNKVPTLQVLPNTVPQGRYSINRMLQLTAYPTGGYTASPVETHGRASHRACAGPKGHILAKAELRFVTAGQRPAVKATPHPRPEASDRIVAMRDGASRTPPPTPLKTIIKYPIVGGGVPDAPSANISGQPENFSGQPENFSGQPENFSGQPRNFSGQPENISGQPENFSGQPRNFSGQPENFSGQPRNFSGQPENISGQPRNFSGQPRNFSGQPENISGQPRNFSGQPENSSFFTFISTP